MQNFEKFKTLINSIFNIQDKKKRTEIILVSIFIVIILMMILSTYEFSKKTYSYIYPAGNDFNNFLYLIVSFNFKYLYYISDFIKFNLVYFLTNLFLTFFDNMFVLNLETQLYLLNNLMYKRGSDDIYNFVFLKDTESKFYMSIFYYEHIHLNFFKKILYNSNLPVFFYFGLLFIFTTIFSLLLLSYFGFYGAFFINLISIVFF